MRHLLGQFAGGGWGGGGWGRVLLGDGQEACQCNGLAEPYSIVQAHWAAEQSMRVMPAHLHFRAVVVGDKMNGSGPAFFRMVAQQYVCAGNDHEGFCSVTEAAEDPA